MEVEKKKMQEQRCNVKEKEIKKKKKIVLAFITAINQGCKASIELKIIKKMSFKVSIENSMYHIYNCVDVKQRSFLPISFFSLGMADRANSV